MCVSLHNKISFNCVCYAVYNYCCFITYLSITSSLSRSTQLFVSYSFILRIRKFYDDIGHILLMRSRSANAYKVDEMREKEREISNKINFIRKKLIYWRYQEHDTQFVVGREKNSAWSHCCMNYGLGMKINVKILTKRPFMRNLEKFAVTITFKDFFPDPI